MNRSLLSWMMVVGMGLAGCNGVQPGGLDEEENFDDDGKYEAWNQANNPAYVDRTFVYEVNNLPVEGKTKDAPIPGDYWATARDSINHRWDGEDSLSPAEKIEKALNKTGFSKSITDNFGIYGHGKKACNESAECESEMDGSSCVKPRGATGDKSGRCIPGWWGICHGWAPYAFSEPAAVNPVTKNGVTFYPGDLEGLMSLAYSENLPTKFLSQRCNKKEAAVDAGGRVIDGECRDMNPGAFYVVAANMLGKRQVGFVEDRTYDLQVWNQPVRGYKVTNAVDGKVPEISQGEAVAKLGLNLNFSTVFPEAEVKKAEKKTGSYTATAAGELVIKMTGTGDADLHVKKGAEATETVYDCRPYGGNSNEECRVTVAAGDKVFYLILGYSDASKVSLAVGANQGTPNYQYNTAAKRFFYVEMDFNWITESSPARESHVGTVDNFTRTDSYQFILEADEAGRILGGEWVGGSRTSHPDFVWWPTGKPQGTLPGGLTYAEVKALNDQAAQGGGTTGTVEEKTLITNRVVRNVSAYETIGVPGGAKLEVSMTGEGSGNMDLYVRLGAKPTVSSFACKSVNAGNTESCSVTAPAAGGTYYVRVRPTSGQANVTVKAKITR
jgi:hypothetical protein